jgi:two-component system nitrogen regulation response regulator GlnG
MSHVLVVDDEPSICWGFRKLLEGEGHEVETASSAEEALELAGRRRPDAVVLDVRLPGMDGLSALRHLRERADGAPVVVITAFGDLATAVTAVEQGAFDYLTKPFDLDAAADVVRRALEQRRGASPGGETPAAPADGLLIGSSPAMQHVFKQIALAAGSDVPVLVTGESGTGKELVAKALHAHGPRRGGPFVPVCPAALSPTVIESELFGHVRGAFTGADRDRPGLLELADGGTVLLDEIGDLPLGMQVKLLRAVEHREVTPVGGAQPRPIDARIVAATNRPLADMVRRGQFREDLFFRLSVFHIELPPLRKRGDDVVTLAGHFLRKLAPAHPAKWLTDAAAAELRSRPWRGNVRELRNAVERAAILARGDAVGPEHLPPPAGGADVATPDATSRLRRTVARWIAGRLAGPDAARSNLYEDFLRAVEPALLEAVLRRCRGNRTAAAELLGMNRATLREKLRKYGPDCPD